MTYIQVPLMGFAARVRSQMQCASKSADRSWTRTETSYVRAESGAGQRPWCCQGGARLCGRGPSPRSPPSADRLAGCVYDEPDAAGVDDLLALRLALGIGGVVVEGVASVGHLQPAVLAPGRADQPAPDAAASARLGLHDVGRPGLGAAAVAAALAALVATEQVQRAVAAIEDDLAEWRLVQRERR